jgi:hypothetical protein
MDEKSSEQDSASQQTTMLGATASSYNLTAYTSTSTISSASTTLQSILSTASFFHDLVDEEEVEEEEEEDATSWSDKGDGEEEDSMIQALTARLSASLSTQQTRAQEELSHLSCQFKNLFCPTSSGSSIAPSASSPSCPCTNAHLALV